MMVQGKPAIISENLPEALVLTTDNNIKIPMSGILHLQWIKNQSKESQKIFPMPLKTTTSKIDKEP